MCPGPNAWRTWTEDDIEASGGRWAKLLGLLAGMSTLPLNPTRKSSLRWTTSWLRGYPLTILLFSHFTLTGDSHVGHGSISQLRFNVYHQQIPVQTLDVIIYSTVSH